MKINEDLLIGSGTITLNNLKEDYIATRPMITAIMKSSNKLSSSRYGFTMQEDFNRGDTFGINSNGNIEVKNDTCKYAIVSANSLSYANTPEAADAVLYKKDNSGTVKTICRIASYGNYQVFSFTPKIIPIQQGDIIYIEQQNNVSYMQNRDVFITVIGIG